MKKYFTGTALKIVVFGTILAGSLVMNVLPASAQVPTLQWATIYNSAPSNSDSLWTVGYQPAGSFIYTIGRFTPTGCVVLCGGGVEFLKFDSAGNLISRAVDQLNTPPPAFCDGQFDTGGTAIMDPAGNYYAAGGMLCGILSTSLSEMIVKYDSLGNRLWIQAPPLGGSGAFERLAVDPAGANVYMVTNGGVDSWATTKFDSGGGFVWNVGDAGGLPGDVTVDAAGNVYEVGAKAGGGDRLLKLNSGGGVLLDTSIPLANGLGEWDRIKLDAAGNIFAAGTSGAPSSLVLTKLTNGGGLIWSTTYSSGVDELIPGLAVDGAGNLNVGLASGITPNGNMRTLQYTPAGAQS